MVDVYGKLVGKYNKLVNSHGSPSWVVNHTGFVELQKKVLKMKDVGAHVRLLVNFNVPREDSGIQSKPPDSVAKYCYFFAKTMQLSMVGSSFWRKTDIPQYIWEMFDQRTPNQILEPVKQIGCYSIS